MAIVRKIENGKSTLFVLIHGQEGGKEDWLEKDGYSKGGNCSALLEQLGYSWLATDLYGHGDYKADESDFDCTEISDEYWEKFIDRSVAKIIHELDLVKDEFEDISIISYSAGGSVAVKLLEKNTIFPVKEIHMAAPIPDSENDDEYSLHNNLNLFRDLKVYMYSGVYDEEVDHEEVECVFDEIESVKKRLNVYEAGHSLPFMWIKDLEINLTEELSTTY